MKKLKRIIALPFGWILAIVVLSFIAIGFPGITVYLLYEICEYYHCDEHAIGTIIDERTSYTRRSSINIITISYTNSDGKEVVFEDQAKASFREGQEVPVRYSKDKSFYENYDEQVEKRLIIATATAMVSIFISRVLIVDFIKSLMSIMKRLISRFSRKRCCMNEGVRVEK